MKQFLILALALAALAPSAWAYNSEGALDPNVCVPTNTNTGGTPQCSYDDEYKTVIKTQQAGYSDQIPAGDALWYSTANSNADIVGLETVSMVAPSGVSSGAGSDLQINNLAYQACILPTTAYTDVGSGSSTKYAGIATGFNAAFRCITRGYALANYDFSGFSGSGGVVPATTYLCISSQASTKGNLVPCSGTVISNIQALEPKSWGTKGTVKVRISSE